MTDQQSLRELRRVGLLANAATGLIALSILAVVTMSISDWHTFRVVKDYVNGVSGVGTEELTGARSGHYVVGVSPGELLSEYFH